MVGREAARAESETSGSAGVVYWAESADALRWQRSACCRPQRRLSSMLYRTREGEVVSIAERASETSARDVPCLAVGSGVLVVVVVVAKDKDGEEDPGGTDVFPAEGAGDEVRV